MNRYYNEVAISPLIRGDVGKADRGVLNAGRASRGGGVQLVRGCKADRCIMEL
jgi:hypothetical protein